MAIIVAGAADQLINVDSVREWQSRLASSSTPADSIRALYNLFDITLRNDSGVYGYPLLSLAERNRDYDIELDVLRKMANTLNGRDDARMDSLLGIARSLPASDDQRETLIFIEMRSLLGKITEMDEQERIKLLHKYIREYRDDDEAGLYDRILGLYKLTMTIGITVGGDLYSDYMDRLNLLISELPDSIGPLSSLYHTQASVIYTINDEQEKSVASNRKMLSIIESLRKKNTERGFLHYNYDTSEYVALRRLISNCDVLSPEEIERYHARLLELAEANPRIMNEYRKMRRSESFYLFGTGRYAEAIPVLRYAVTVPGNADYRAKLYHMLISCAVKTGDAAVAAEARTGYIAALEARLAQGRLDKIRELQVLLDATTASRDRLYDVEARTSSVIRGYRIALVAVSAIALAAIVAAAVGFRRRRRRQ